MVVHSQHVARNPQVNIYNKNNLSLCTFLYIKIYIYIYKLFIYICIYIIKNNLSILYTDERMKKIFPPNTMNPSYRAKKILRKFYRLLCFLLSLSKLKFLLLVVRNVMFVRILLHLTLNSNIRLQEEYIISAVNLLVITLMLLFDLLL